MSRYRWTGAATGWATGGNWSPSGPPSTSGDSAFFGGEATGPLAGSDQSATTLDLLRQYMNCVYAMGSAATNITVKATKAEFGVPAEDGSSGSGGEVYWNASTLASAVTVFNTKSTGTSGLPAFNFKGSGNNTLKVFGGSVGVATAAAADTATVVTLNVMGGNVTCGTGTTLTNVYANGGILVVNSAITTLYANGATVYVYGTGKITTLHLNGGTVYSFNRPSSGNTIDTMNMDGGTISFAENNDSFTVGATNVKDGGGRIILATPTQGTFTGGFVDSFTKSLSIQFSPQ